MNDLMYLNGWGRVMPEIYQVNDRLLLKVRQFYWRDDHIVAKRALSFRDGTWVLVGEGERYPDECLIDVLIRPVDPDRG